MRDKAPEGTRKLYALCFSQIKVDCCYSSKIPFVAELYFLAVLTSDNKSDSQRKTTSSSRNDDRQLLLPTLSGRVTL